MKRMFENSRLWPLLVVGCISLAVFASYSEILKYSFTDVDTWPLILTSSFANLREFFTQFTQELLNGRMINARYYRPLLSVTYGMDRLLWGLRPMAFHLMDLFLHMLNGICVYGLARLLFKNKPKVFALLAACLFVVHPIHVENVPAIARRAELLYTLFTSLALCFFLLPRRSTINLLLSAFLYFLALLSKEAAIVTPALMVLALVFLETDFEKSSQSSVAWKTFFGLFARRLWPFAGVTLIYFLIRFFTLAGMGGYVHSKPFKVTIATSLIGQPLGLLLAGFSTFWSDSLELFLGFGWASRLSLVLALFCLSGFVIHASIQALRSTTPRLTANSTFFKFMQSEEKRGLAFLFGYLAVYAVFLIFFGFNFRYLYAEIVAFSLLLAYALWSLPTMLRAAFVEKTPQRAAYISWACIILLIAGNTVLGSPVFIKEPLRRWEQDAEMAERLNASVNQFAQSHEPEANIYLVNLPYQVIDHLAFHFFSMPLSVIVMEHSIQAYVDLHQPEKRAKIVGLSYVFIEKADENKTLRLETSFDPPNMIAVTVHQGGTVSPLPWEDSYGPQHQGTLYETTRPDPRDKKRLLIRLMPKVMQTENRHFFVAEGSGELIYVRDPFESKYAEALAKGSL